MTEYIEREAARNIFTPPLRDPDSLDFWEWLQSEIDAIPAAEVRPVVLCRDCIFRSNEWTGCPKLNGTITGDEFFCAAGIKREER